MWRHVPTCRMPGTLKRAATSRYRLIGLKNEDHGQRSGKIFHQRRLVAFPPRSVTLAARGRKPMTSEALAEARIMWKVSLRLLPFLFLLYVVNILDRANIGFARLQMLPDLGMTEQQYAFGRPLLCWSFSSRCPAT